jgi:uncharacterized repeat protein (TIGR01451 family)
MTSQALRVLLLALLAMFGSVGTALAASCAPAATQGTAPNDYKDYCWLDFSSYNNATAASAGGQQFSFTLPDQSTISFTLTVVPPSGGSLHPVAVPSYSGAAFGNSAFIGIPGLPVLYTGGAGTFTVTFSNITVLPPPGGSGVATFSFIAADGESTNSPESLSFTTNANPWALLASPANGGQYPQLSGVNSTTVTETGTTGGNEGSYVFGSSGNPTTVSATLVAGGLQGIVIGVRYASVNLVSVFSGARKSATDQIVYNINTQAGTTIATGTTSGTATTGFAAAEVPTIAASYPFSLAEQMASGSADSIASYTHSLTCTNANTASTTTLPNNYSGQFFTIPSLAYGDSVSCTYTNTADNYAGLSGTVYDDANHNSSLDAGEGSTGLSNLFAKLTAVSGGVCTGPALSVALVSAADGTYGLPGVNDGTYCVILNQDDLASDITPSDPSGWIGTQAASGIITATVAGQKATTGKKSNPSLLPENFGLYHGAELSGTVFDDNGTGSGTPNDGVQNGTEAGVAGVAVTASSGATVVDTENTASNGAYTLWIPASYSGNTLSFAPTVPGGWLSTGGSPGTTLGGYVRPAVSAVTTAGTSYSGVNFGIVAPNTLTPSGNQSTQAGASVYFAETYTAQTGGSVVFTTSNVPNPAGPGWGDTVYLDNACSGTIAKTDTVVSAPIIVTAGQKVCLLLDQTTPSGATNGATVAATLKAAFTYTNASPALSATATILDKTTVGQSATFTLTKAVTDLTTNQGPATSVSANPGDVLQYTITATNNGSSALSSVVINDAPPAYTGFLSSACPTTLPAGITGCATTGPAVGATGAITWTLTGSLTPGTSTSVSYQVTIQQ